MGEKKGALFNAIVVVVITSFVLFAVNLFFPGLLTDIFSGASDTVDTGFDSINGAANPATGFGGGDGTP